MKIIESSQNYYNNKSSDYWEYYDQAESEVYLDAYTEANKDFEKKEWKEKEAQYIRKQKEINRKYTLIDHSGDDSSLDSDMW